MASRQQPWADESTPTISASSSDETMEAADVERDLEKLSQEGGSEDRISDTGRTAAVTDWDGPDDPENPHTWSESKKMYHILVPTILGFVV